MAERPPQPPAPPGPPYGPPPGPPSGPPHGYGGYPPQPYPSQYPPAGYPMPYAVPQWAQAGPAPGLRYAGFWIRFLAYLVDALIVDVPLVAIGFAVLGPAFHGVSCTTVNRPFGSSVECTGSVQPYVPLIWLVGLLLAGVYFVVLWSHFGQTLGQKLCGLRVVDAATGGRITTGRAIGRYLGFLISGWVLDIGLIWAAFDQRKQGWHDKMASTFVVRKA